MNYKPQKGINGVIFYYKGNEKVKRVSVAGTFNSWNSNKNAMEKARDNLWKVELNIPKGRHLYKIVVNDNEWILDPQNPSISEDAQNNSSITVTENEVLIRTEDISKENPGYLYRKYAAIKSPEWLKKAIIYELHVGAFTHKGFKGIIEKLNYFKELGINTLWLMPFSEVGEEKRIGKYGDPYAVKDYLSIDRRLGTKDQLKEFIAQAHKNDIKVIMDWVINRGSIDNILTKTHPDYFTQNEKKQIYYEVPHREYFAGLNFESNKMRKFIISAMKHWVDEFGFDGFRLDDSDLTPHDFLNQIRKELKQAKEDIILISQSYDEYHHIHSCDLTYDGILRTSLKEFIDEKISSKDFINTYNSFKYSFPKNSLRMRWIEEKEQSRALLNFGEEIIYPVTSLLMLLDGIPFIMMGQEFNEKTYKNWTSLFNEYQLDWNDFDKNLFEHFKQLISIRKCSAAFFDGELEFIEIGNEKSLAFIRKDQKDKYLVIINFSNTSFSIHIKDQKEVIYRTNKNDKNEDKNQINRFETKIYKLI